MRRAGVGGRARGLAGELPRERDSRDRARQLLEDAHEQHLDAEKTLTGDGSLMCVVVSGLLRLYAGLAQAGRQVTIHYLSAGDLLGVPSAMAPRARRGARPAPARRHAHAPAARLAGALPRAGREGRGGGARGVRQDRRRPLVGQRILVENVFMHVRQRVARHLLDLAVREDGALVVRATQQDLADAIGSVREVVSRGGDGTSASRDCSPARLRASSCWTRRACTASRWREQRRTPGSCDKCRTATAGVPYRSPRPAPPRRAMSRDEGSQG